MTRRTLQGVDETKKKLPAHSVKTPVMMDLLALEEEYDEILKRIEQIRSQETASEQ
ncbi:MAG: hypothetical protein WCE56_04575 [Desulfobacterales bacterium]